MWLSNKSSRGSSYDEEPRFRRQRTQAQDASLARFNQATTVVVFLFSCIALFVIVQLIRYQIVMAPDLSRMAQQQRNNTVTLLAARGTIYDRNGNVLAISRECRTVVCNPKQVNDPSRAAQIIADVVGGTQEHYLEALSRDSGFSYVVKRISVEDAQTIQKQMLDAKIQGIFYYADMKRDYPYGAVAAQILGVVNADGEGLTGLELYYNDALKGTNGEMIFEAGRKGTPIAGEHPTIKRASKGEDIVLGIDVNLQRACEEIITKGMQDFTAKSASAMVTDPNTGEILAACSTPFYDPLHPEDTKEGALDLKPVSSSFEPGSIFKIISEAIALDSGRVNSHQVFDVPAEIKVGSDTVRDADKRDVAMDMTLRDILIHSSNVGSALVAQKFVGADTFAQGIDAFLIGKKTGIDFPGETAGLVKKRIEYDGATLGAMSFGQAVSFPHVQMVQAVGSIANGGNLYTPHFLSSRAGKEVEWPSKGTSVSAETAQEIASYMRDVVNDRHHKLSQVEGYDIAGKTGTAEQADETGVYRKNYYVSSFIGFGPTTKPRALVYVALNGTPHLAFQSAAPLFSQIMKQAMTTLSVPPQ